MLLIAFICLLAICILTGTFYSIMQNKSSMLCVAIKLAALVCCALLAVVTANLSSAIGGYSLFVIAGLVILVATESLSLLPEKTSLYYYLVNISKSVGFLGFLLAGLLVDFNVFALLFGLFCGAGLLLVAWATRKDKQPLAFWISNGVLLAITAMFLGQGFTLVVNPAHLFAGILYLLGGALSLTSSALNVFKKEDKVFNIITSALYILSLILIASSIYLI